MKVWKVEFTKKSVKGKNELPEKIKNILALLVQEMGKLCRNT